MTADTIYALASGRGRSGVALFRLSGPGTRAAVRAMAGGLPPARRASLRRLVHPTEAIALDRGLVLFFPAPASFTGEDCAEFHVHGGAAVVRAMSRAFEAAGLRLAEAGEFTRRAFLGGKLGLDQVEGLADLVEAETEQQRRQALSFAEGRLGAQARRWRSDLLEAAALLEAHIDFSDEGDVTPFDRERVLQKGSAVLAGLKAELARARAGERVRDGVCVVIAGPPNAGKSTLLNALAGRDAAIVSAVPGTTRDMIEVAMDIGGVAVSLVDTAGLRDSDDPVEQAGIARARRRAAMADLVLWLSDARPPVPPDAALESGPPIWRVLTKADAIPSPDARDGDILPVSALTGLNLDRLMARLETFAAMATESGESALITRERHQRLFVRAAAALQRLCAMPEAPVEILAEEIRAAGRTLAALIGTVDVEDILSDIFARFCIGK